jgi:transposase
MAEGTLFELPESRVGEPTVPTRPEEARVLRPIRDQLEWAPRSLESLLPSDHSARAIWAVLERLDLSGFYASIKAVVGRPGHPTTDPEVLLALWLYATAEGVGSARQLDRLCDEHDGYRWLRGGVPINYHMLSDFRVANDKAMDELLTEILASMMVDGLLTLRHVAQDGMRTRASAGAGSFRRKETLERCLTEAREQVKCLAEQREHPDPKANRRQQAAQERAVREREERIEEALRRLPEIKAAKERQGKTLSKDKRAKVSEPRVSTTDPEARVMKMPDGGFRPALNLEVATDVHSQVIVGVGVVARGSDGGEAVPMVKQINARTKHSPDAYLVDGNFATRDDITALESQGIAVYAPSRPPRTTTSGRTQADPRPDDTPEVARWRERMQTDEAKEVYKERAASAECVNAQLRSYGLRQLLVRGTRKALSVLLLVAVAHNVLRWLALTGVLIRAA